jgi:hypothetical protein
MEEAEQCDHLVVMAAGRVVVTGTAAGIISGREAAEIHCDDIERAFAVLDADGVAVQVRGSALRAAAPAAVVARVISRTGIPADVRAVPADLEEAFVSITGNTEAR